MLEDKESEGVPVSEPEPLTPEQKARVLRRVRAARRLLRSSAAKSFEAAFWRAIDLHALEVIMADPHCPGHELAMTSVAALARYIQEKHLEEAVEKTIEDEDEEALLG